MQAELVFNMSFNVIGGLGIFLMGMKHMSEGMQAVAGHRLRKLISAVTTNRLLAVFVGIFVTCVIQSSSVTSVMVIGFVNAGLMNLMQAIGVIFGANVGTTITGWILAIKIGKYGLPILGIAAIVFLFSRNDRARYMGMAIMGIGMVFFGLELMSNGFKPIRQIPEFLAWFHRFHADTYGGVIKCALVGSLLTAIVQSSSATLGITMGLAATGVIGFESAAALVLGQNVGTTITAYLASLGATTNAKRAAYAHIVFNVLGVIWITAVFQQYINLIKGILPFDPAIMVMNDGVATFPHAMAAIALVHTGFNVANTIIFLPFMGVIARLIIRLVPEKEMKEIPHLTYLDVRGVDSPVLGIAQSRKELVIMSKCTDKMLTAVREVLASGKPNEKIESRIFQREEILDNMQKEITLFLSQLVAGQVSHDVTEEAQKQLRIADEYESISDYVASVLKMIIKLRKNGLFLSAEGLEEILDLHDHVVAYVNKISEAVSADSIDIMSYAHSAGGRIHSLMKIYRKRHLERLTKEQVTPLSSLVFTDILAAYRRIKDHALNIAEAQSGDK